MEKADGWRIVEITQELTTGRIRKYLTKDVAIADQFVVEIKK